MDFNSIMAGGMTQAEGVWGEEFTLDGGETYVGTFNEYSGAHVTGPGGQEDRVDGIMVASLGQFGTFQPERGQRLTLGGRRYTVVRVLQDSAAWTLILKGVNE
jgi:hypothetical protein